MREKYVINGRGGIPGVVEGIALVTEQSFQGDSAFNQETGDIIQKNHPLEGYNIKDKVLVLAGGRGSTGWSCRLNAVIINGFRPAAMVFPRMDSRTGVAAAVAGVPVVTDLDQDPFKVIKTGDLIRVDGDNGIIELVKAAEEL